MELTISPLVGMESPEVTMPDKRILEFLQESGIRKMVSDHYDRLVTSEIKHLFPESPIGLQGAKKHAADFFVQILGGGPYYNQSRGKPMMVRRHMPFEITPQARIVWLTCYQEVLSSMDFPEDLLASFWQYLDTFSKWMVNKHT